MNANLHPHQTRRHYHALNHAARIALHPSKNQLHKIALLTFMFITAAVWQMSAHADELGRLFYTPQERAQLAMPRAISDTATTENPDYFVVNGMIQKQGGNRIVWVNGKQQKAGYSNENQPATVPVTLPGKTQPVQVKVGQRLKLDTPASKPIAEKVRPVRADEED
ncbi:MAG: hypothetical protein HOP24_07785 [Sideroxydans sp.]|nr:hypothetical protein [Sideroxydans sp.]